MRREQMPALPARILVWVLVFILAGMLVLCAGSFLLRRVLNPAGEQDSVLLDRSILAREAEIVEKKVRYLAEVYGFSPDTVLNQLPPETLSDLGRQGTQWWNQLLREGTLGGELQWDSSDVEAALAEDPAIRNLPEETAFETIDEISKKVREILQRAVLPLRLPLLNRGMREITERADLPELLRFAAGLPWLLLAACAVISGLIALLVSRKLRMALKYLGAALGGSALVILAAALLSRAAGLYPLIREASESLAWQAEAYLAPLQVRGGIVVGIMFLAGLACLILYRRGGKREAHEA